MVDNSVKIISQPEDWEAENGESVTLTVEAENVVSYQWQYSTNNGTTWQNSGSKTKSITFTVSDAVKKMIRRCVLTGKDGVVVYTNEIGMVDNSVKIISQPEEVEAEVGDSVTLTVEAENVVAYQWQYSTNNGAKWQNSSSKTNSITFTVTEAGKKIIRRCELTGKDGDVVYTDEVGIVSRRITLSGVTYYREDDLSLTIESYSGSSATALIIPETVEGLTVKKVGESAFEGHTEIVSIDLPDTIIVIGKKAFKGCTSLSDMH